MGAKEKTRKNGRGRTLIRAKRGTPDCDRCANLLPSPLLLLFFDRGGASKAPSISLLHRICYLRRRVPYDRDATFFCASATHPLSRSPSFHKSRKRAYCS